VSGEGIPPPAPTAARWVKAVLFAAGTFIGLMAVTLGSLLFIVGACPRDDQLRLAFIIFCVGTVIAGSLAKYVFRRTLRSAGRPTQEQAPPL
jgi:hypothetical protein